MLENDSSLVVRLSMILCSNDGKSSVHARGGGASDVTLVPGGGV